MTALVRAGLKVVARGPSSAGEMSRRQASEVFAEAWSGAAEPAVLAALLTALRMRGESVEELLGALDSLDADLDRRGHRLPGPSVVIPSYNGARRLPTLTPLLALLLVRAGVPVVVHGLRTEATRLHAFEVFQALGYALPGATSAPPAGCALPDQLLCLMPTEVLHPGLAQVLALRHITGMRNLAHSLVKLWNPCGPGSVVMGCYTHPEFAMVMRKVFHAKASHALLLRGTEGEPVADPRRRPALEGFRGGQVQALWSPTSGSLTALPSLPPPSLNATAEWTAAVLEGRVPVPAPIADQVQAVTAWYAHCQALEGACA